MGRVAATVVAILGFLLSYPQHTVARKKRERQAQRKGKHHRIELAPPPFRR